MFLNMMEYDRRLDLSLNLRVWISAREPIMGLCLCPENVPLSVLGSRPGIFLVSH